MTEAVSSPASVLNLLLNVGQLAVMVGGAAALFFRVGKWQGETIATLKSIASSLETTQEVAKETAVKVGQQGERLARVEAKINGQAHR